MLSESMRGKKDRKMRKLETSYKQFIVALLDYTKTRRNEMLVSLKADRKQRTLLCKDEWKRRRTGSGSKLARSCRDAESY